MRNVPQLKEAARIYAVNRPNQHEGIYQPIYDFQTYPNAGSLELQFFQVQAGQSSKTNADTNMEAAGSFPSPKHYLCFGLQVVFFPSATLIARAGLAPAALDSDFIRDVYTVAKSGFLELYIGSKVYLLDAPLGKFPPDFRLGGFAAISDTTTAAATQGAEVSYAVACGKPYDISPVFIPATQNFRVSLKFPSLVALPSGVDGRIGVILNGFQYRLSQ